MSMLPPSVGSDIPSQCGKCKRETWHVILAMVGDEVMRVQCKVCDAQHRYRPAGPASGSRRSTARAGAGGSRAGGSKGGASERAAEGPTVESDLSRPIQPYRADTAYQVADRVEHPVFGVGVVELVEPGKITVYFPGGRKVMAAGKSAPRLERPPPIVKEAEEEDEHGAPKKPIVPPSSSGSSYAFRAPEDPWAVRVDRDQGTAPAAPQAAAPQATAAWRDAPPEGSQEDPEEPPPASDPT